MKSSPSNTAPLNAPNMLPRATLRWSMAKPVTSESESTSARSRNRTELLLLRFVNEGQNLRHVGLAGLVRMNAEHGSDPAHRLAECRADVPRRGIEAVSFCRRFGIVQHHHHHITRLVHREHA